MTLFNSLKIQQVSISQVRRVYIKTFCRSWLTSIPVLKLRIL